MSVLEKPTVKGKQAQTQLGKAVPHAFFLFDPSLLEVLEFGIGLWVRSISEASRTCRSEVGTKQTTNEQLLQWSKLIPEFEQIK